MFIKAFFLYMSSSSNAVFSEEPIKAPLPMNGSCPGELYGTTIWLKYGSHCYLPVSEQKSWDNASLHCAQLGSTLVSIHSYFENEFVSENMPNNSHKAGWIGLRHNVSGRCICDWST